MLLGLSKRKGHTKCQKLSSRVRHKGIFHQCLAGIVHYAVASIFIRVSVRVFIATPNQR
jgi:hypothetical protein